MVEVTALVVFLYLSGGFIFGLICMTAYVLLGGEWKELSEYPVFLTAMVASVWLIAWPVALVFIMIGAVIGIMRILVP